MATHKGSEGTVKVGANTVAEIRSWSIEETAETIEDTALGDAAKTFLAGTTAWSGSLDCMWDETDSTGQGALTAGASVTLNLYPEGAATGDAYFTGTALVTGITNAVGGNDEVITASFSFQGTGALSRTTV